MASASGRSSRAATAAARRWSGTTRDPNAGFSTAKPWLPVAKDHLPLAVNRQQGDPELAARALPPVPRLPQQSSGARQGRHRVPRRRGRRDRLRPPRGQRADRLRLQPRQHAGDPSIWAAERKANHSAARDLPATGFQERRKAARSNYRVTEPGSGGWPDGIRNRHRETTKTQERSMADLTLRQIKKSYGSREHPSRHRPRHQVGRVHRLRRPVRLRQVHAAADDRRPRGDHVGRAEDRRRGRQRRAAVEARHRHGVPVLRALSAHDGLRQHGLRHEDRQGEQGRDRPPRAPGRRDPAADQISRPPAQGDVGRPAPARRHRPRHRAQPEGVPVRRAAVEPRRRAARRHPHRDRQAQGERCPRPR